MTLDEVTRLCKVIAVLSPAQRFEADTPAIWSIVLADVRYEDAQEAVVGLGKQRPYIAPSDIVAVVRTMRAQRLQLADKLTPNVDAGDEAAYRAELAAIRAAVADGTLDVERYQQGGITLTGAPPLTIGGLEVAMPDVTEAFRRAPAARAIDYAPGPIAPLVPDVDPDQAAAMEAERARQLVALAEMAS